MRRDKGNRRAPEDSSTAPHIPLSRQQENKAPRFFPDSQIAISPAAGFELTLPGCVYCLTGTDKVALLGARLPAGYPADIGSPWSGLVLAPSMFAEPS